MTPIQDQLKNDTFLIECDRQLKRWFTLNPNHAKQVTKTKQEYIKTFYPELAQ